MKKGESLRDTVQTIEAMGVDAIVVRHALGRRAAGSWPSGSTRAVINAGDGWHEHPTQALLDCYTIRQRRGSLDGLQVAIVGDIKHSRVARSNVLAFTALGAEVTLVAPPTLLPPASRAGRSTVSHDLDEVLPKVDVVLRSCACSSSGMTEALLPVAARVHAPATGSPATRGRLLPDRRARHAPRAR